MVKKVLLYLFLTTYPLTLVIAQTWEPVGGGIQGGDSDISVPVFSLLEYNGKLYAGGLISKAGNLPVHNIASWDGKKWDSLRQGVITGPVTALAVYQNTLCVGGKIYKANGRRVNNVARWVDTARTIPNWYSLGTGIGKMQMSDNKTNKDFDGRYSTSCIKALLEYSNELYAIGGFGTIGDGSLANGITRWDTKNWNKMPYIEPPVSNDSGGGTGWNGHVTSMAIYNKVLYVSNFSWDRGDDVSISTWNGKAWVKLIQFMGILNYTELNAMIVHDSVLYVAGRFSGVKGVKANNIIMWDGKNWSALGKGIHGAVSTLAFYHGKLYAGGRIDSAGGKAANNVAAWNGTDWAPVGEGLGGSYVGHLPQVATLAVYKDELYAGGYFNSSGGKPVNHIAKLNLKGTKPLTPKKKGNG